MILAIESTCDETGAAIVRRKGSGVGVQVVANITASSAEIHNKYGGIVPEVAAREQLRVIGSVIGEAMKKAGLRYEDLEAIAVAYGPWLMGSLLVGVETAKTLAYVYQKRLLAVNHMQAHLLANWIESEPKLPGVGLVVSGGHTDLVWLDDMTNWRELGGTRDDAAGECFDKCARVLGLPYPGGVSIERAAENAEAIGVKLPRPLKGARGYEMSFSGLKAALMREVKSRTELSESDRAGLAKEVNEAVVESLVEKTEKAIKRKRPRSVLLAGGVAANKLLRKRIEMVCDELGVKMYVPEIKYCTDNAAMIGAAAVLKPKEVNLFELSPDPVLDIFS